MNICGIICEYNPFHNGHLMHIERTKKELGCDIVCIMSGNYVQRGDFSILHKTARAEAAILSGADVVIELPLPWSIATAERFSRGAVSILNALGGISHISFGAECENTEKLHKAAEILCSKDFDPLIMEYYNSGISYASARAKAMATFDKELSAIMSSPNNVLGIEYLKALIKLNSPIVPFSVARTDAEHDSSLHSENIASASLIREKIAYEEDIASFVPQSMLDIYKREKENGHALISKKEIERAILASLKKLSPEEFSRFGDVSEGLQFRLYDAVLKSTTLTDAVDLAKTKRYAHSRIRRCLLNAFLGVENTLCKEDVPYARILAFSGRGRDILKDFKKTTEIPLITKPTSVKKEGEKLHKLLALESRADDIYSLFMESPLKQGSTFTTSPLFVKAN